MNEDLERDGFFITSLRSILEVQPIKKAVEWAVRTSRKNALWPYVFGTACCSIEMMATMSSRFDTSRFGAEVIRFSPRQADLMIVGGRVTLKMMPVLQRIWQQMPEPKWCISMGACASCGGVFDTYTMIQGVDRFIPVDVYVPGCPPRPEGLLYGIMMLQQKIMQERMADSTLRNEMEPDPTSQLYIPPSMIDELSEPFGNSIHQTRSGL